MFNLTQHRATPDQVAEGVFEPAPDVKGEIQKLLTFDGMPTAYEIRDRAISLAYLCAEITAGVTNKVMIGGAPFLMPALERELRKLGMNPYYAFSAREVVEETAADGTVKKSAVFKHRGFIPAVN